jgi:hypothetical protein
MGIRTTVTLEEDVLERVKAESKARGLSFRETLNDLLRLGLITRTANATRPPFKVKPVNMGYRPELNYDDVEGLLTYLEGENHR